MQATHKRNPHPGFWPLPILLACLGTPPSALSESIPNPLTLQAIYQIVRPDNQAVLLTANQLKFANPKPEQSTLLFHAVVSREWPQGLAPLFEVDRDGLYELRRRPPSGRENITDAFFFILPAPNETDTIRLAGRWDGKGIHADGAKDFFGWDLTLETNHISGRFDPDTDYRFANITGGVFLSNQFQLSIVYLSNHYSVTGRWTQGTLTGTWNQINESGQGTWLATRPYSKNPVINNENQYRLAPLYEWRHEETQERRYHTRSSMADPKWQRAPSPLGQVWILLSP